MTGFRGPDKLQRKAASVFIQRHKMSASDDFIHKEEHSGGTSLDGRLDEVRSSLTVPVDSMVQFQVADEDELHLQLVSIDYDNCRSLEQSAPRVCRHCGKALIGREADACKHEQTCVLDDPRWH